MPVKKNASAAFALSETLYEFLGLLDGTATVVGLQNVFGQLLGDFEPLAHLDEREVAAILQKLAAGGRIVENDEGQWGLPEPMDSASLRKLLASPAWAQATVAVSRAFPIIGANGECDARRLHRDLRNAFMGQNVALLSSALTVLRDAFPAEYSSGAAMKFLLDEPMEWLVSLPEAFLGVLAWQLVPLAMREFRPIRPLLKRLYELSATAKPQVICPLVDCAILSGEWKQVATMVRRLPAGLTARLSRVAWLRYITGKDDDAVSYYLDALDGLRRDRHAHDVFFVTIGGIFMLLAELRTNTEKVLASAENHVQYAIQDRNEFRQVYILLEKVIRSRSAQGSGPDGILWVPGSHLNNALCCIAQYWLDGRLQGGHRLLLDGAAAAARTGGYLWIAEECEELCRRLDDPSGKNVLRWHDERSQMPFMLDTIVQQSSWGERMVRLEHVLTSQRDEARHRLVWFIETANADAGIYGVKPMEQTSSRSGRWTRCRKFGVFRHRDYTDVASAAGGSQEPAPPMLADELELSVQDKFACDTLRRAEEFIAANQALYKGDRNLQRRISAQVVASLVGNPRLFLENNDGRQISCVEAVPVIHISGTDDSISYRIDPSPEEGDTCVVRLENGEHLCVYRYDEELQRLMEVMGDEFALSADSVKENSQVIGMLLRRHRIVSDCTLDWLGISPDCCDDTPVVRLSPENHGLKVELVVCPFGNDRECFQPGTGTREVLCKEPGGRIGRRVRNFEAELSRVQALVVSCAQLNTLEPDGELPWTWHLEGQACYELSIQLQKMNGICRVLWPVDQKFVCNRTLTLSNVSIHTESYQNWFSVDGEVQLEDGGGSATLAELMQAAVNEKRSFMQLSDGQMVALSEELRRHLESLARIGEFKNGEGGGQVKVCRFLMPFITDVMNAFGSNALPVRCQGWIKEYNDAMRQQPQIPVDLNAKLRKYQEDGFVWLSRLDAAHAGACLADDMGLGKTLQTIAFMLAKASEGPALVVAPTSVCSNWLNEINRFAPALSCEVFGSGKRSESFKRLGPYKVMVVSYGLLQSEQHEFRKVKWRLAVLDEAQAIKNSHAKRSQAARGIDADFRLVTTGTPVENNLAELWSIFDFIIPGLLGSYDNFRRRFEVLIDNDNNQEASKHLRNIVSPFLLRRCKDQVLNELPPKSDIDYPIEMSPQEKEFYDKLRRKILADLESHQENEGQKHIRVLTGITKLRLAVDHPSLVEGGDGIPGSKLEAFLELLKGVLENGHKVLVFSQFVRFLSVVREALNTNRINYLYLDGAMSARERKAAVDGFQSGAVPVFLISLKAGGLGLNLTQADYVIHLDSWWNPAVENQASDRAYRLGQDKPVTIYHLQTMNTIEERIKALHQRKRDLADKLLTDSDTIETVPLEELLKLLREE